MMPPFREVKPILDGTFEIRPVGQFGVAIVVSASKTGKIS
jgi:hypothetical protein